MTGDNSYQLHFYPGLTNQDKSEVGRSDHQSGQIRVKVKLVGVITSHVKPG
jgi:hypothetical protein